MNYTKADSLLTPEQAADILVVSPRYIRRLIQERRLDHTKIGRYIRIRRSDLEKFIAAGSRGSADS